MPDPRLPERVSALLMPVPWSGCWIYVGTRFSRNGYGRLWWNGKERPIHKVVWEIIKGPVPPGLVLDHVVARCLCRACACPEHLEPVTVRVNTLRGAAVLFR